MGSSIYGATQGATVQSHYLDVIANNLANAQTAGFKADTLQFGEYLHRAQFKDYGGPVLEREVRPRHHTLKGTEHPHVQITGQHVDLTQGSMRQTGNALDVAIDGEGFFRLRMEDEGQVYTRDGRFMLGLEGELLHNSGGLLLDINDEPLRLNGEGAVHIAPDGVVTQGGVEQGRIAVYALPIEASINKAGQTLFTYNRPDAPPVLSESATLAQGFLEGSNVNAIAEMTRMIQVNRHFEYMTKLIKAYNETDIRSINEVGRTQG